MSETTQLPEAIITLKEFGNNGKPGEVYICGTHGVPDAHSHKPLVGTFFYWEKDKPKEANSWLSEVWVREFLDEGIAEPFNLT